MDCFAEFIIGRRCAPTRWLAMTVHLSARVSASRRRLIQMSNNQERMHPQSRGAMRPSFAGTNRPEEGAGKAGCWPHPWPACNKKSRRQSPQVQPIIRPSPRNGFNGFLRALPGDRAFLPPSFLRSLLLKNLTPASGRQDHTTSPSAKRRSSRNYCARRSCVHRIPHSRFVTIGRNAPLHRGGMRNQ